VNNALNSPCLTEAELADIVARNPTHPAARLLRPFVTEIEFGLTRSELEDGFKAFCRTHDLPRFKTNVLVHGYIVDVYFPHEQLIVELDSWLFHKGRRAFETDRTRDADALTHGIPTVRVTHERITSHPDAEAARINAILERRRQMLNRSPAPRPDGATATPAARPSRRRAPDRRAR
jgi:very-short-patch-repair endonuclease